MFARHTSVDEAVVPRLDVGCEIHEDAVQLYQKLNKSCRLVLFTRTDEGIVVRVAVLLRFLQQRSFDNDNRRLVAA